MIYGYARVSTTKQKLERQIENIKTEYPNALIVTEKYTGTKTDRPAWNRLYKKLLPGDTVVFDEVSRMSRNENDGFKLYKELYKKDINLVFLKEPQINTDTYKEAGAGLIELTNTDLDLILSGVNAYILRLAEKQIAIAFQTAQAEVDNLHKRTSEGVRRAQLEGKQVGREAGATVETKKAAATKAMIKKHSKDFDGKLNDVELMKLCGVSRNSYYKYKAQLKAE